MLYQLSYTPRGRHARPEIRSLAGPANAKVALSRPGGPVDGFTPHKVRSAPRQPSIPRGFGVSAGSRGCASRARRLRPSRPEPSGQGREPPGSSSDTCVPSSTRQESTPVRTAPVSTAMRFG